MVLPADHTSLPVLGLHMGGNLLASRVVSCPSLACPALHICAGGCCLLVQVRHRCPCDDKAVCGTLEAKVKELAQKGLLPPFDRDAVNTSTMGIASW